MIEKPLTPEQYARHYRAWEFEMLTIENILCCTCGACAICCIVRPFAIKAEFEDEVPPKGREPTDMLYEDEYDDETEDQQ